MEVLCCRIVALRLLPLLGIPIILSKIHLLAFSAQRFLGDASHPNCGVTRTVWWVSLVYQLSYLIEVLVTLVYYSKVLVQLGEKPK